MPKIGFPMPSAKNRFQILNLHPKKHVLKKHGLKGKNYQIVFCLFPFYAKNMKSANISFFLSTIDKCAPLKLF